jgi:hypothetical protein
LFRKDLISAMKLADSEQLASEEYLYITDSWKQDWEKGVQVPVNEDLKHEPKIRSVLYFIYTLIFHFDVYFHLITGVFKT